MVITALYIERLTSKSQRKVRRNKPMNEKTEPKKSPLKWILLGIFVFIVLWGAGSYNGLISRNEAVTTQWAQVENVYQRRADLIPNLVATVKGYAAHERKTLTAVIEARSRVNNINVDISNMTYEELLEKFSAFQNVQGELSSALSRLMVVVERYPNLKADALFQNLQFQLEGTENRIAQERKRYNDITKEYNVGIKRFPTVILANIFLFEERPYFAAEEGSEIVPEVNFDSAREAK